LIFYLLLFFLQRIRCRAICLQRLVQQVLRLDDIPFKHPPTEVIVVREGHHVIRVRGHNIRIPDVRAKRLVRNPKHTHRRLANVSIICQDRTNGKCLDIENRILLVKIPRFLYIIRAHVGRRDITFVHDKRCRLVALARNFLIKNMETVEHILQSDLMSIAEILITIKIFIDRQLIFANQLKYRGK